MAKLAIINGSPRAAKSNSKAYAAIFKKYYKQDIAEFNINKNNHLEICSRIEDYENILFVFPLYADGIPVTLLNFLKKLEEYQMNHNIKIHCIVNCGFIEYQQNTVAIKMIKLFCKQKGFKMGSYLSIGSGEAILKTPFAFLVKFKIKQLAKAIENERDKAFFVKMPLSKKLFIKASTQYWIGLAKANGVTKEEMETMQIE
ncbi:MAG: hypothetical protein H9872_09525 [Candidatus Cellulosilyticum pullistercoris]|uniref:Flavodoxin-like fold domain-containing protein n=1 Tax=Candidatus Cellulosilyticum pullistercoris TaxID=2838521 RepID=A0A9E2NP12_9FIRM|nr:hypothetical protein [Candidatus Cellulosilyticum pullistercoris]